MSVKTHLTLRKIINEVMNDTEQEAVDIFIAQLNEVDALFLNKAY